MNQIIRLKQETPSAPIHFQFCGGLMRLIGSEPHPVEDNLDLLQLTELSVRLSAYCVGGRPLSQAYEASRR